MKILIAANPASNHTFRWVKSLCDKNIDVVLFGFNSFDARLYQGINNLKIYSSGASQSLYKSENKARKIFYLFAYRKLKKIIKIEKPDILHSHYASSYGFVSALTGFKPLIVSVWGSDIYVFPRSSFVAKKIIKYTLNRATRIFSTSYDMARETKLYIDKNIDVTPFGVDVVKFKNSGKRLFFDSNHIVIGTIKNLEKNSGIDYLIKAFSILKIKYNDKCLKLVIAGDGNEKHNLKKLCSNLNLNKDVIFTGYVNQNNIVDFFSSFDIYVAPSLIESFGVAVLEASACEIPVVCTNAGGLPEVVINEQTGLIVPKADEVKLSEAIGKLVKDEKLRKTMGQNARKFVEDKYNWVDTVNNVVKLYNKILY